jgi:hypothetical protein
VAHPPISGRVRHVRLPAAEPSSSFFNLLVGERFAWVVLQRVRERREGANERLGFAFGAGRLLFAPNRWVIIR